MARKRSFLGKSPGGKFRGIPGNPTNMLGWGGVFKKKGDWGILNPMEWAGFGSRMRFGEVGPRPQGQLQEVIGYNLGIEEQLQQAQRERPVAPEPGGIVKIPTRPGPVTLMPSPTTGGGKKTGGGGTTGGGTSSGKSGSNAGGGTTAPAGGGKSGGGTAKPTKLSASAKKALSNPVARGR